MVSSGPEVDRVRKVPYQSKGSLSCFFVNRWHSHENRQVRTTTPKNMMEIVPSLELDANKEIIIRRRASTQMEKRRRLSLAFCI